MAKKEKAEVTAAAEKTKADRKADKQNAKAKKPGFFRRIANYFRDLKNELKKVVWPSRRRVFGNTLVVLAAVIVIGAFVVLLDFGFGSLRNLLFMGNLS